MNPRAGRRRARCEALSTRLKGRLPSHETRHESLVRWTGAGESGNRRQRHFGYGIEFEEIVSLDRLGAIVTKGISLEPMAGHAPPRIVQTAAGMLNAIGLQNVGVEDFVERKLPPMSRHPSCKVIVNVFGQTVSEYIGVIDRLNDAEGIAAYELNASCPNVHEGGMTFGADPYALEELVERTKKVAIQPLIVKLSPNVTSIGQMARVCAESGRGCGEPGEYVSGDVNRCRGAAGTAEQRDRRPFRTRDQADRAAHGVRGGAVGGDSDSGDGGIVTPEDAVEFMLAGATAVQVGTASYADPRATERLAKGMEAWCKSHDVAKVASLTGALKVGSSQ